MKKRLAALMLALHLMPALAADDKDPLDYPLRQYGFLLAVAQSFYGNMRDLVLTKHAPRRTAAFQKPRREHPTY